MGEERGDDPRHEAVVSFVGVFSARSEDRLVEPLQESAPRVDLVRVNAEPTSPLVAGLFLGSVAV
jgi:hypothetical protein